MQKLTRITIPTEFLSEATFPPSPHFDDEATLLTARPVVPLNRLMNLGNIHNYVLTWAILLTAALVGAIAALSIDRFQSSRSDEAAVIQETSAPANLSISETEIPESSEPQAAAHVSAETTKESPETSPDTKPALIETKARTTANHTRVRSEATVKPPARTETQRQTARTRRPVDSTRDTERPRDAGRIREIFEGLGPF